MISQQRLKELLRYDPSTGVFTWLVRSATHIHVGDVAGGMKPDGYVQITVCGVLYRAHRLAWFWMTGEWPADKIDHKNRIRNDNQWINLRSATSSINNQNRTPGKCLTGFQGVTKNWNRFVAAVKVGGKRLHIGTYPTPELAHSAYLKAKRQLHPGCTI